MKVCWLGMTWGGPDKDWYYFYLDWSWVGFGKFLDMKFAGIHKIWYDCPHACFKFGPVIMASWSTKWTTYDGK